ncbi:DUF488 domain-containing protein [Manganibacter manganicus]|jgi:uncharacterized protein YeaO (DUF488 family)|uniref:MarR family transcriptional regulator n=1 Tax=Manganibacter manganicus TaxID=1873176 RepID=A0A1V8RQT3_9HYPH|nr:DUF488 domain-containing protein [Pseudaminobacter manganicus]OQM75562.1 hypothetical protein BFN67_17420 [Pseudaminobacter manganicus]
MATEIAIKRVYEAPSSADGQRVLVDRLWPRGVKKEDAKLTEWVKAVAPSDELRKWFGHDPAKWDEFQTRYRAELKDRSEAVEELRDLAAKGKLTLLYGAHDEAHNNAVVLAKYLQEVK